MALFLASDDESAVGRVQGVTLTFKKMHPPVAYGSQKRFKLPGVGVVRVNIDKHVEQALKQQSHDIAKFTGQPKRIVTSE